MDNDRLTHLRGLLETKQWDKAWAEFQRLKEEGPSTARLLLMGSHAAFGQRDLFKARSLAESALSTWTLPDPLQLQGQVRFHLGMVTRELGDTHVALEQFQLFLTELSPKYPELSMGEGKAYFYLALTYRQRRSLDEAVTAYNKAIDCFERDGLPTLVCTALQNLAWLYCHMGHPDNARACLDRSEPLLGTPENRIHQTLGNAYHAAITGRHLQAAQLCEAIFRQAERGDSVSAEERSQAAWIAGTVALEQANLDSAGALAEMALAYAIEAKDARLMNDVSSLRQGIQMRRQAGA